ncbi:MAG: Thiamine biosynthesis protein-like protein [Parcubacteria group bacterium Athens1014_10]|nr:MAG: Thiamine biosynthesis protein-like protein [Parcubacteria group bacterium Athens1014_10]TSD05198.1 MAG: Thiamine biosynthesis protein-like protein [Parcubacteria group bacterium Athens0714_12]
MIKKKKIRAIVLFSGGLDSILAIKILEKQKIEILALIFESYFFNGEEAEKIAKELKFNFRIFDFSEEHLKMVKNPKYGYGRAMNPCVDCHALMLKKAKEIMEKEKFDFVATGEVLGERPMSQNAGALKLIEKQSALDGYLIRPLSAKLLIESIPEKSGWIKRSELLDISGRSRKRQIALAEEFAIKNYPSPAGGCLLTESAFGERLKKLLINCPNCGGNDIELLKSGRHLWENGAKIIIGRNKDENEKLGESAKKGDILIQLKDYPGPLTIIRNYQKGKIKKEILDKARELTQYYSLKARNKKDLKFKEKIF